MKAHVSLVLLTAVTIAATAQTIALAAAPEGVSPGARDWLPPVSESCPTFSWEAAEHTLFYQLMVYALPAHLGEQQALVAEIDPADEVLYTTVAGGATSWTPSADLCFAQGAGYVWFVRSVRAVEGDEIVEASEWSAARFFAIPSAPSLERVAQAMEALRAYQASAAGSGIERESAADPSRARSDARRVSSSSAGRPAKSAVSGPAAIRGEQTEAASEAYGVVGLSASALGAGVAAVNTDGGADLVLDGSADGEPDTGLYQWGVDRPSAVDETFFFQNTGAGRLNVHAAGDISGSRVVGDELWVPQGMVVDDEGIWRGQGETVPCASCVTSSDIADGTITDNDLSDDAVTEEKIEGGAVTSAKIADGTITAADVDPSGGLYVSKSQLYINEVSQTWSVQGTLQQDVYCNDLNDLPLSAYCKGTPTDATLVTSSEARFWTDPSIIAGWRCEMRNRLGSTVTTTAAVICIDVP